MNKKSDVPQKGISVWLLKAIGVTPSARSILIIRLSIITISIILIWWLNFNGSEGSKYGNYEELKAENPELFQ